MDAGAAAQLRLLLLLVVRLLHPEVLPMLGLQGGELRAGVPFSPLLPLLLLGC